MARAMLPATLTSENLQVILHTSEHKMKCRTRSANSNFVFAFLCAIFLHVSIFVISIIVFFSLFFYFSLFCVLLVVCWQKYVAIETYNRETKRKSAIEARSIIIERDTTQRQRDEYGEEDKVLKNMNILYAYYFFLFEYHYYYYYYYSESESKQNRRRASYALVKKVLLVVEFLSWHDLFCCCCFCSC